MQGKAEAEAENRARQLQDYQNARQQFEMGHQYEQQRRADREGLARTALSFVPMIPPGEARERFAKGATDLLAGAVNGQEQYGLGQLGSLSSQFPNLHLPGAPSQPGAQPTGVPPNLPVPDTGAANVAGVAPSPPPQAPAGGEGTTPPAGNPPPGQDVLGMGTEGGGGMGAPPPMTPPPGIAAPAPPLGPVGAGGIPADTASQASAAVAAQFPSLAQGMPAAPNILGTAGGSGLAGALPPGLGALPIPGGGTPPSTAPAGTVPPSGGPAAGAVQAAAPLGAGPKAQQMTDQTAATNKAAAAASGGSGGNVAGTVAPTAKGTPPTEAPAQGVAATTPATITAPPPAVPPSASVGTAPVTVPGGSFQFPGIPGTYAFSEVNKGDMDAAEKRLQAAAARLNNTHLDSVTRTEVERVLGSATGAPNSQARLDNLNRAANALDVLGAGAGSSIYSAEQRAAEAERKAANAGPEEEKALRDVTAYLAKANITDPVQVAKTVTDWGHGVIAYMADDFAHGNIGGLERQKFLQRSLDKIASENFGHLDPTTQKAYIDATLATATQFGMKVNLPPRVYLQMTPAQKDAAARGWENIGIAQDRQHTAEQSLALRQAAFHYKVQQMIDSGGQNARGRITDNVVVAASREPLEHIYKLEAAYRHNTANQFAASQFDTQVSGGKDPRTMVNDPNPQVRTLAQFAVKEQDLESHYQNTVAGLLAGRNAPRQQSGGFTPSAGGADYRSQPGFDPEKAAQALIRRGWSPADAHAKAYSGR